MCNVKPLENEIIIHIANGDNMRAIKRGGDINRLTGNISYVIKQKSGQFWQCIIYDQME